MKAIPSLGGDMKGYDINVHGHVVGSAKDAEDNDHAFLYKDSKTVDLYEQLSAKDKGEWKELREAYSISDDGTIVGRGRYWTDDAKEKDSSRAFRIKL
jgi:probable HAF family extracellular repeat protein